MPYIKDYSISPKGTFIKALTCNEELDYPPFWELEFHLWDVFSQKKIFFGNEFLKLSKRRKILPYTRTLKL